HPFPTCFVCGPRRSTGDGLRIFPGRVAGQSLVAAPWYPDASLANGANDVRPEFVWAALDCTSAFAVMPVAEGRAIVLGELSARIERAVMVGEKCVAVGWPLGVDGRKRFAGSAIYSGDGDLVAVARATWIEVAQSAFAS
ncbi:MAG TPA: hypothetical protein VFR86_14635, partial [Burkholderiaceae bacterium]|nr:hypothetical protein [Burkholderiaceae bacterium]